MAQRSAHLIHRAVSSLKGKDTASFLQKIVSNDIRNAEVGKALYSLILDQRGRVIEDLFIYKKADEFLLESDASNQQKLITLLRRYIMHKKVSVEPIPLRVYFADESVTCGVQDPRVPTFGRRVISDVAPTGTINMDISQYISRRFEFGICEGVSEVRGSLPLSRNADFMNGMSGDKGCYIGQETSATALNAARVRQRVMPFTCERNVSGKLSSEDGQQIGAVLACDGSRGLAVVTLSHLDFPVKLQASGGHVAVYIPSWWPPVPSRPYRPT